MKENPVLEKSINFALRIIKLNRYLVDEKKEYVLSKELLVSGTHIGKHIKEAVNAESRQVFITEMGVARRKASETEYWLQLLFQADFLTEKAFNSIEIDREEVFKLLTSIVKTSKENV
jgi:four helix bundle protein